LAEANAAAGSSGGGGGTLLHRNYAVFLQATAFTSSLYYFFLFFLVPFLSSVRVSLSLTDRLLRFLSPALALPAQQGAAAGRPQRIERRVGGRACGAAAKLCGCARAAGRGRQPARRNGHGRGRSSAEVRTVAGLQNGICAKK
jgi:hypothetical protein